MILYKLCRQPQQLLKGTWGLNWFWVGFFFCFSSINPLTYPWLTDLAPISILVFWTLSVSCSSCWKHVLRDACLFLMNAIQVKYNSHSLGTRPTVSRNKLALEYLFVKCPQAHKISITAFDLFFCLSVCMFTWTSSFCEHQIKQYKTDICWASSQ